VPIAVHGIRPVEGIEVPYIGFDEYESCYELGRGTALLFKDQFPGKKPVVMVVNSRTVLSDIERERGFAEGFREIFPDSQFVNTPDDNGTIEGAMDITQAALVRFPEINVIFNTSDARALGTIAELRRSRKDSLQDMIVAGVGGSKEALGELLDVDSPWKTEIGLAVRESAEKSYEVLMNIVYGDMPLRTDEEFLIKSRVFLSPSLQEAQEYLLVNHGIEDFSLE
jgi:ABC-type sugar transport system substrate-binding protein